MKEKEPRVRDREIGGEEEHRTEHSKCQAFSIVVRIGSPSPASECVSPLGRKGRGSSNCLRGRGGGTLFRQRD
jgi:hypothetical protein